MNGNGRAGVRFARAWIALLMAGAASCCLAEEPFDNVDDDPSEAMVEARSTGGATQVRAKRGRIAIAYQRLHTMGLILDSGDIGGATTTDTHSMRFDLDYLLNDRWEAHLSLPFIRKRSSGGPGAHRLDILTVPHPEATFLDDGKFHSGWQDWSLGLTYHTHWRGFGVAPTVTVVLPTHDYSHFANAAIGQNLWKLNVGLDVTRHFDMSNFFYSFGYSYEFVERVLGYNTNKQHFRISAGYFFSPQWSARIFVNRRDSRGLGTDETNRLSLGRTSEIWYQHDRLNLHDYMIGGVGFRYQINDDYALSVHAAKMLRGRAVHDLKYAFEVQLSRSF